MAHSLPPQSHAVITERLGALLAKAEDLSIFPLRAFARLIPSLDSSASAAFCQYGLNPLLSVIFSSELSHTSAVHIATKCISTAAVSVPQCYAMAVQGIAPALVSLFSRGYEAASTHLTVALEALEALIAGREKRAGTDAKTDIVLLSLVPALESLLLNVPADDDEVLSEICLCFTYYARAYGAALAGAVSTADPSSPTLLQRLLTCSGRVLLSQAARGKDAGDAVVGVSRLAGSLLATESKTGEESRLEEKLFSELCRLVCTNGASEGGLPPYYKMTLLKAITEGLIRRPDHFIPQLIMKNQDGSITPAPVLVQWLNLHPKMRIVGKEWARTRYF